MLNTKADNLDVYERAKRDDEQWEREHGDTREKIERDARVIADNWSTYGAKSTFEAYDIIALLDRQAAIAADETSCAWEEYRDLTQREIADLQAKVDELNAQNTRLNAKWAEANVQVEKLQAELGSEPFCEQVKRWLNGDAPQECRECGDGCYKELSEQYRDDMLAQTRRVADLQAQLAQCKESYADAKNSRDRLQAQLDSAKYDCLTCDAKAEIQRKVDELQAELATAEADNEFLRAELAESRPQRTIEDVLFDFWNKVGKEVEWSELKQCVNECADELRWLGVDDDR